MAVFNADGTQSPIFRCAETDAKYAYQNVTPPNCHDCPLREELVKRAGKRIPQPSYLSRASDNGDDTGFVKCVDRLLVVLPTCCGGSAEERICDSVDAQYYKRDVIPIVCAKCPVRRE
jgi:hypothetical protein